MWRSFLLSLSALSYSFRAAENLYHPLIDIYQMKKAVKSKKSSSRLPIEEFEYIEDLGRIIREAREKMGLTQEDLSRQLNEKVTIIRKIEAGEFNPPIELARKIEKLLKIKIIVPVEEDFEDISKYIERGEAVKGVSLGFFIKKMEEKDVKKQ
jgi:putative transcription factor